MSLSKYHNYNSMTNGLHLQTDGMYVQFGSRVWYSEYGNSTDCWYNMIKIIDDEHLVVLGSTHFYPFFSADDSVIDRKFHLRQKPWGGMWYEDHAKAHDPHEIVKSKGDIEQYSYFCGLEDGINKTHCICGPDEVFEYFKTHSSIMKPSIDDIVLEKPYYDLVGLDGFDFDVMNVVSKLSEFDWTIFKNMPFHSGIYICEYDDTRESDSDELEYEGETYSQYGGYDFYLVNDASCFFSKDGNPNMVYSWGSPCNTEIRDGELEICNSFPFYFVPFDLSIPEVWKEEYDKWKIKYVKWLDETMPVIIT